MSTVIDQFYFTCIIDRLEDYEISIEANEGITTYLEANFEWPTGELDIF